MSEISSIRKRIQFLTHFVYGLLTTTYSVKSFFLCPIRFIRIKFIASAQKIYQTLTISAFQWRTLSFAANFTFLLPIKTKIVSGAETNISYSNLSAVGDLNRVSPCSLQLCTVILQFNNHLGEVSCSVHIRFLRLTLFKRVKFTVYKSYEE